VKNFGRQLVVASGIFLATITTAPAATPDRALVVLRTGADQVFASWRLLATDVPGTVFAVEVADHASGSWRAAPAAPGLGTNATFAGPAGRTAQVRVRATTPGRAP